MAVHNKENIESKEFNSESMNKGKNLRLDRNDHLLSLNVGWGPARAGPSWGLPIIQLKFSVHPFENGNYCMCTVRPLPPLHVLRG